MELPYHSGMPWWLKLFMLFWGGAYLAIYFLQVLLALIFKR